MQQKLQLPKINIAIDGYSSCGKGTLAKYLAGKLNYLFVDSGAMYRAVTYYLQRNQIEIQNETILQKVLPRILLDFEFNNLTQRNEIILNGENIEKKIRTMQVASQVSDVAKITLVRKFLVQTQQKIGINKGVVMDGRDIGTVVFPSAELKIFMTASPEIRAHRRLAELIAAGENTTYQQVFDNLKLRDKIDSERAYSPLTLTEDYKVLDNTELSLDAQNAIALQWAQQAIASTKI